MSQIRVNWGSPTLTATPRISSPPSPNRARPKPSPSPAPGLSLGRPPPPLGFAVAADGDRRLELRRARVRAGNPLRASRDCRASGAGHGQGRIQSRRSGRSLGDAVGRAGQAAIEGDRPLRIGGAKYQRPGPAAGVAWSVTEPAQPLSDAGVQESTRSSNSSRVGSAPAGGMLGADGSRGGGPGDRDSRPAGAFRARRSDGLADMRRPRSRPPRRRTAR